MSNPFETSIPLDYSIFREKINPDYEEKSLVDGGRIIFRVNGSDPDKKTELFDFYIFILTIVIGESLTKYEGLCIAGVRLVIKKFNGKIEVWTIKKDQNFIDNLLKAFAQRILAFKIIEDGVIEFESFDKSFSTKYKIDDVKGQTN